LSGFGGCPPLGILGLALGVDCLDHCFPEIVGQDIVLSDVLQTDPIGIAGDGIVTISVLDRFGLHLD
jgi:hypothetical protein